MTCKYIKETNVVYDKNGIAIPLKQNLDCQSKDIVYLIECSNCGIRYVGETSQKLKDRINQHRSDIKRKQYTTVATNLAQHCPNIEHFSVTPLEKIDRMIPESYTFLGKMDCADEIKLLQKEQLWIHRFNTLIPNGLNKRQEIPPPIPFVFMYNDKASDIANLVKEIYEKIQERGGNTFPRIQLVTAYKKNANLRDLIVRSKLD